MHVISYEEDTRMSYGETPRQCRLMMLMSFIVLSETKTSIPPYTLWGTLHHEKEIKHM